MAVFRVEKTKGYTVMSNHHLHNRNLSFKAKGLLSFMLSLPENWNYTEHGLSRFAKDGEEALWLILGDWIHTNVILEMKNVMNAYLDKPTTETAKEYLAEGAKQSSPQNGKNAPDTGDDSSMMPLAGVMLTAVAGAGLVVCRRKKA